MALSPGTPLGPYEILEPIGAGGMGEVYRARDTKLKRDVAIKVLPEAFAKDEQRMKRFAREAEVLASLNHPNIASIYGLEESDGITALVLELVEGPTLAERIAEGPIPLDEALPIAKQMAEGLEAAHEEGVIHRDLKPANAKVKYDGTVKILDFGLAKVFNEEAEGDSSESPTGLRQGFGPASVSAAATRAGVIMGTQAYMSPEQVRGKSVDKRADIWAFGAVLYEMLTGRRAFEAEDVSLTLAEVMKSEPPWDALPSDLSPTLRMYLTRCLNKDPKKRLRDIGEVRLALEGAFELPIPASEPAASKPRTLAWISAVFATAQAGLFRVPAGGGEPRQLTKPDGASEIGHVWPEMLPGNEGVLYAIDRGKTDASGFDIAVLSLDSGESRVLIRGGTSPRYARTGHLVYVVEGALMVVPFDAETLETTGDEAATLSGVFPKHSGATNFDVSDDGVLIYLPGDPGGGNRSLVWVDRLGREEPLGFEARPYTSVALSPDGNRVVSSISDAMNPQTSGCTT
ncbi:MAG: serine/threonine protein kinase [Acidobacteria bacterium]|nr:MAG: serine/threonine protein kinase [Acidobacteriota bacterium]